MESIVQDHERRITDNTKRILRLEEASIRHENGMLRIETAVLSEGTEQRKRMEALQDKLMNHFFGERTEIRSHKAKLSEVRWTTVAGLLGSGSLITAAVLYLIEKL